MNDQPPISRSWLAALRFNPLPPLLVTSNPVIVTFARHDLLGEAVPPIETLWELPAVKSLLRRQLPGGAWPNPGGTRAGKALVMASAYILPANKAKEARK